MTRADNSDGVTAAELMAQLAADPEFQERAAEREQELQSQVRQWREAERPIVADLARVGVEVGSVWDLVHTSDPYPAALPVLMDHFERGGYPDRVMEGLGRALAVKPAVVFWERLRAVFLNAETPGQQEGAAVALAACATEREVDDLIALLSAEARGSSRVFFLRPIQRLGGELGRRVLESLRDDSTLGREARALLTRGGR